MRHLACQNDECANEGAPYWDFEDLAVLTLCPLCGKAMAVIPAPQPAKLEEE